ncbi:Stk1 family PASTA domain-containing Ser/Thr kinase [Weissella koreensis]|uniref:non-specific serine/threonine protein kinase n=1 Tax=Weissella koreensis TaxID=165096 RepID=A0A7H1MK88_9LACO|nr:Stk1 family PASTA domain-containing Ser/Thr kinase [Weissella koreensis]AVH74616.1 Stk1 family PASTA domain-containing Ser/Thr kinase [Weissella koreensis]QGN19840.1 Stk1 family PASTA domain-containing Ser/Thr kinase [Weissella koreensis]QNT63874.1 Stk1 family PASTA domain-containing Ser/Thr kinase [Weissella koreensis]
MQVNELIADRYQIIEPLGEGGMANVYRAHDQILNRDVSVKLLRLDMRDNSTSRQRFENEIAASTELVHPNIIQVYDFGESNQLQFLVSEYVKGEDLKRYIASHHPLTITRTLEIMDDVLAGVAMAHSHNIVHRDLKPQNILIDESSRAKITDFGIALAQSSLGLTKTDVAIGSIHYMSPEQVKGGMATTRSDIYALGIILYEMLVGKVPFDAQEAVSVALMHSSEPMPFVRDIDPRIPQALENVILRATQKNPMDRYSSVNEMRQDLSNVMSTERLNEPRLNLNNQADDTTTVTKIIPNDVLGAVANQESKHNTTAEPISRKAQRDVKKKSGKGKEQSSIKIWSKPRRIMTWIAIAFSAILAIFLIFGLTPNKVTISDFTGDTESSARQSLKQDGVTVGQVYHVNNKDVKKGYVIKTDPKAGQKINKGDSVDLYISSGAKMVRVGDYTGEKYSKVASQLRTRGYKIKAVHQYNADVPSGYISEQDIPAEYKVDPSKTTITFTVSRGQKSLVVPDFSDMTQNEAQKLANKQGVIVSFAQQASDSVDENNVISQSIKAGTKIKDGTVVTVAISSGANPISVPDFVGKTYGDVKSWADKNGIEVNVDPAGADDSSKVTSQNISSGGTLKKGGTLKISVSSGSGNSSSSSSSSASSSVSSTSSSSS